MKVWSQSTCAADASAQSDRVVVVGVVEGVSIMLSCLAGSSLVLASVINGKCKDLPLQQQGCISFNLL